MFCRECGNSIPDNTVICMKCGVPTGRAAVPGITVPKSRAAFVLLGFFLGSIGVHNFYAGYTAKAIIQLSITVLTAWFAIPPLIIMIWAIIEICVVKQDAQGVAFS